MNKKTKPLLILMADDDEDDRFLTQTAFEECNLECKLLFAKDGTEVLELLDNEKNKSESVRELPNLILLDLNMPRKNGWQVLNELKSSESLKHIPVLIFTTSKSPEHVLMSYSLGANSFITKPSSYNTMLEVVQMINRYWNEVATLA
ncbi:MAG: response regulator [Saprospiraceae bacterium]